MNTSDRSGVIAAIFTFMALVFVLRLGQIQLTTSEWRDYAARLTEEREPVMASRGLVYDRNGELVVSNVACYDLMFTPRMARNRIDTLGLARLLGWEPERLIAEMDKARVYSWYRPSIIMRQLPPEEYARISGELWRFPGTWAKTRSIRSNLEGLATHLIGEYSETTPKDLEADPFYTLGDFKGKSGLEGVWETQLRGKKGVRFHMVDVRNNYQQPLSEGRMDTLAIAGDDMVLTIDRELQRYAQRLMQGKRGSVVAIEPATGEVLVLVSSPDYDPDLLVGPGRARNYDSLLKHPGKPLFNRALRGTYRPGSIFKMIQGLVALEQGVIQEDSRIYCNRGIIGCHGSHTQDNLNEAIIHSCNPYFHEVMRRMIQTPRTGSHFEDAAQGLAIWTERVKAFGLGTDLGGNLPGAKSGFVPDTTFFNRVYGKKRWAYSTIYSLSIGEGELLVTPLQMANIAAAIGNRGWYRTPHAIRNLGGKGKPPGSDQRIETGVPSERFAPIVAAMEAVVAAPDGTGKRAQIEGLTVCGKTGTVQNDPDLEHSVFMAFAPCVNPQIAISVYVENAGFGGTWAAPLAALIIEKHVLERDSTAYPDREQRILEAKDPFPRHD
ncbi:MAG: hypothetical protein RJA19_209 [Bacteroidota bacterium]|jgi:penicillin-binding protein 2